MEKPDPNNLEFKLSQLLDGDLSPDEEAALLARLRDDDELSRTCAGYRRLDEMLGDLAAAPELADVDYDAQRADIMATLARRALLAKPQRRVLPWMFGSVAAAAAVAVLALGATLFFKTSVITVDSPTDGLVIVPVDKPADPLIASALVLPSRSRGTVESALQPMVRDRVGIASVSIVQIRVNYLDDDEFMLSDPDDNPLAHGSDIGRPVAKPLPAGTVLMIFDRPVERDYDMFDVF